MRKSTILMFWVAGLVFTVIGVYMTLQLPLQELQAPASLQSPVIIPGLLLIAASVANFIGWVGAIVLLIRLGAWGWLVAVILLGGLGMLAFLIFGPDEYLSANDYDAYTEYGDYGDYSAGM
ncbi:MAG TPA: hypothetical protein VE338_06645 [Ktedonobacterales bacterium]|jgi:hypothetical protein|nr:hypothetical protein [Ktedonobacterales bacterium]